MGNPKVWLFVTPSVGYLGDHGLIISVSTEIDLTDATSYVFHVSKPNGVQVDWVPTPEEDLTTGILNYTVEEGDLDVSGFYLLQAEVSWGGNRFVGEPATIEVLPDCK